jgi:hypothetical protein
VFRFGLLAAIWTVLLVLTAISDEAAAAPPCPRVDLTLVEPSASSETRPVKLGERTIFVRQQALTTTGDISEIKVGGDEVDSFVLIKYKPEPAARLLAATTDHEGLKLAFVVDDDVWLAFMWRGPYGIGPDGTQLSVRRPLARAQELMEAVRGCIGVSPAGGDR